jgi:hypothetical protein
VSELEHFAVLDLSANEGGLTPVKAVCTIYVGIAGSEPYLTVAGPKPRRGGGTDVTPHFLGTLKFRDSHVVTSARDSIGEVAGGRFTVGDAWIGGKRSDVGRRLHLRLEELAYRVNASGELMDKFRKFATKRRREHVKFLRSR